MYDSESTITVKYVNRVGMKGDQPGQSPPGPSQNINRIYRFCLNISFSKITKRSLYFIYYNKYEQKNKFLNPNLFLLTRVSTF
jgi:hypothetical protein